MHTIYRRLGLIGGVVVLTLTLSNVFQITLSSLLFLYIIFAAVGSVFVQHQNFNPMLPWSAGRRTVHKSGKRSSTFIENSENSSTLSNYSQEDRRKGHSSSFSRSPIKITKRPRFQSPAGPLLNSPLSSPSAGGLTPANNASLQISPVSVTAKRYHVCSPELHSHASPCETSTDRFLAMGQRRYPTHQAQYSSLGLLPSVKWKGGSTIQNALSSHSPHGRNSPVTVKIAAHDGIRSPSPMLQRHNGMVDPLNKETILSALRESKKRTLMQENNEDNSSTASSLFEKGSKRRRCDNSSSCSGSTWVTATPSQSGRNTPIYNGDLNNTDLKSSEGGSMKRSRNAIECSYSSSRRVRQRKNSEKGSNSKKRKALDNQVEDGASFVETPRKILVGYLKTSEDVQEKNVDTPTEKRVPVVTKERSTPNGQKKPATDTPIKSEVRTPKLLTPKLKSSTTPLRKKVPLFSILEDKSLLVPASPYQYTKDDVMEDRKRAEERVKRMMEGVEEPQNKQNDTTKECLATQSSISSLKSTATGLQLAVSIAATSIPATVITTTQSANPLLSSKKTCEASQDQSLKTSTLAALLKEDTPGTGLAETEISTLSNKTSTAPNTTASIIASIKVPSTFSGIKTDATPALQFTAGSAAMLSGMPTQSTNGSSVLNLGTTTSTIQQSNTLQAAVIPGYPAKTAGLASHLVSGSAGFQMSQQSAPTTTASPSVLGGISNFSSTSSGKSLVASATPVAVTATTTTAAVVAAAAATAAKTASLPTFTTQGVTSTTASTKFSAVFPTTTPITLQSTGPTFNFKSAVSTDHSSAAGGFNFQQPAASVKTEVKPQTVSYSSTTAPGIGGFGLGAATNVSAPSSQFNFPLASAGSGISAFTTASTNAASSLSSSGVSTATVPGGLSTTTQSVFGTQPASSQSGIIAPSSSASATTETFAFGGLSGLASSTGTVATGLGSFGATATTTAAGFGTSVSLTGTMPGFGVISTAIGPTASTVTMPGFGNNAGQSSLMGTMPAFGAASIDANTASSTGTRPGFGAASIGVITAPSTGTMPGFGAAATKTATMPGFGIPSAAPVTGFGATPTTSASSAIASTQVFGLPTGSMVTGFGTNSTGGFGLTSSTAVPSGFSTPSMATSGFGGATTAASTGMGAAPASGTLGFGTTLGVSGFGVRSSTPPVGFGGPSSSAPTTSTATLSAFGGTAPASTFQSGVQSGFATGATVGGGGVFGAGSTGFGGQAQQPSAGFNFGAQQQQAAQNSTGFNFTASAATGQNPGQGVGSGTTFQFGQTQTSSLPVPSFVAGKFGQTTASAPFNFSAGTGSSAVPAASFGTPGPTASGSTSLSKLQRMKKTRARHQKGRH